MTTPRSSKKEVQQDINFEPVGRREWENANRHIEQFVEAKTSAIAADLHQLSTMVSSTFNELRTSISRLGNDITSMQRPQYGNWLSAGGLAFVLLGGMWAIVNSNITSVIQQQQAADQAIHTRLEYIANGTNRFTEDDWQREEGRITEWQRLQDAKLEQHMVQLAKLEVYIELYGKQLDLGPQYQDVLSRLDERARYHMEIDDPRDTKPADVYSEVKEAQQSLRELGIKLEQLP